MNNYDFIDPAELLEHERDLILREAGDLPGEQIIEYLPEGLLDEF
jgi:hypothetical protein